MVIRALAALASGEVSGVVEPTGGYDIPAVVRIIIAAGAFQVDETNDSAFVRFVNAEKASARENPAGEASENARHSPLDPTRQARARRPNRLG